MNITAPTYFQNPNDLVDHWLPHLKEVELKVLLIIIRKTFGWHKIRDRISLSQLEKLTGSHRKNVSQAVKSLEQKGLIYKSIEGVLGTEKVYYELVVNENSNNSYQWQFDTGGGGNRPPGGGGNLPPTKETNTKDTIQKQQHNENKPVVVVSSCEDEEKAKLLEGFNISPSRMRQYLEKPIETLKSAIEAFNLYQASNSIDNPSGCLHMSIMEEWKPTLKKEDKVKAEQKKMDDLVDLISSRKYASEKFIKNNWDKFKKESRPDAHIEFVRFGNEKLYYKDENFEEKFKKHMRKAKGE